MKRVSWVLFAHLNLPLGFSSIILDIVLYVSVFIPISQLSSRSRGRALRDTVLVRTCHLDTDSFVLTQRPSTSRFASLTYLRIVLEARLLFDHSTIIQGCENTRPLTISL